MNNDYFPKLEKINNTLQSIKNETLFCNVEYTENEYCKLYTDFGRMTCYFGSFHEQLISALKVIKNRQLSPEGTVYFKAQDSRNLLTTIHAIKVLFRTLDNSNSPFDIDSDYESFINEVYPNLSSSGGSNLIISEDTRALELYYTIPIFRKRNTIKVSHPNLICDTESLEKIGSGSYGTVYKYFDNYYEKPFAVKVAKSDLTEKEDQRFKQEYDILKKLSSPYIVEVYSYNSEKHYFIMEYLDGNIEQLIQDNSLSNETKWSLSLQLIRAISYLHEKNICHRDIAPANILFKKYENCFVIKVSDFGLVKNPDYSMSSDGTSVKGRLLDPQLQTVGFDKYQTIHDLYPLAITIAFILTGKLSGYDNLYDGRLTQFITKALAHEIKDINDFEIEFKLLRSYYK